MMLAAVAVVRGFRPAAALDYLPMASRPVPLLFPVAQLPLAAAVAAVGVAAFPSLAPAPAQVPRHHSSRRPQRHPHPLQQYSAPPQALVPPLPHALAQAPLLALVLVRALLLLARALWLCLALA